MCHIRTYVHQVLYALATLSLGIALEELAHLEKEHHEYRLRKLCLCSWEESYAQCSYRSHRHQEVLIKRIAVRQSLRSLFQRSCTYQQIGYQVHQQQLPCRQRHIFLYYHCPYEQHHRCYDGPQLSVSFLVLMMMFVMMFVCHIIFFCYTLYIFI